MKPGTKPKPTVLKAAAGNPGRRRLNVDEPKYRGGRWYAPRELGKDGKRLWRRLVGVLGPAGVITEGDLAALELMCESYEDRCAARRRYLAEGMTVEGSKGSPVISPYVRIAKAYQEEMRWFLAEFGLTPSSRTRIKVDQAEEKSLAELLFEGAEEGR